VCPIPEGEAIQLNRESYGAISGLDWTPDSREIVYTAKDMLWRVSADGGIPRPVPGIGPGAGTIIWSLSVSPQGDRLIYTVFTQFREIWRFPGPKSSISERVASEFIVSNSGDWGIDFSPDSQRIAFVSKRSISASIWVCAADGQSNLRQLTFGDLRELRPRWSPDGEWIAFESTGDTGWDVFVVPSSGVGGPRQLTAGKGADRNASWSQDGNWLYFTSDRSGENQIWKIPVEEGEVRGEPIQVTEKGGACAQEALGGVALYYGKPDNPGIWKVPTGGGEEILVLDHDVDCNWDLAEGGIYFASSGSIQRFDLESGEITPVSQEGGPFWGLTVSPDGEWIAWDEQTQNEADLMLVENFR
jgi:Tol biopolymer transport system component